MAFYPSEGRDEVAVVLGDIAGTAFVVSGRCWDGQCDRCLELSIFCRINLKLRYSVRVRARNNLQPLWYHFNFVRRATAIAWGGSHGNSIADNFGDEVPVLSTKERLCIYQVENKTCRTSFGVDRMSLSARQADGDVFGRNIMTVGPTRGSDYSQPMF